MKNKSVPITRSFKKSFVKLKSNEIDFETVVLTFCILLLMKNGSLQNQILNMKNKSVPITISFH